MRSITLFIGFMLVVASASASVNISLSIGQLYDQNGTALPNDALVLLIADTGNDGFASFNSGSLNVGDYLNADDQILYRGSIDTGFNGLSVASVGGTDLTLGSGLFPNLQVGEQLAAVWFPTLDSSDFSLVAGTSYGLFTTLSPLDGSNDWSVPEEGGSPSLKFLTEVDDGSNADALGNATLTVAAIPEPAASTALAAFCALGLIAWHRRRRA